MDHPARRYHPVRLLLAWRLLGVRSMLTRILLLAVGVFAGAACVGAAGDDEPKLSKEVRDELKLLEGEWRVVAAEQDGAPVESKTVVRFAGGRCTLTEPGAGLPPLELTLAIDPTKKPKQMDVTNF